MIIEKSAADRGVVRYKVRQKLPLGLPDWSGYFYDIGKFVLSYIIKRSAGARTCDAQSLLWVSHSRHLIKKEVE